MRLATGYPPNIDEIRAAFTVTRSAVFTYGDVLYCGTAENLAKVAPTTGLLEHEEVHARQQRELGPEEWWVRYIADPDFRLEQEVEAYGAQWRVISLTHDGSRSREIRRRYLDKLAWDLSSPLYGRLVSYEKAKSLIKRPELVAAAG